MLLVLIRPTTGQTHGPEVGGERERDKEKEKERGRERERKKQTHRCVSIKGQCERSILSILNDVQKFLD